MKIGYARVSTTDQNIDRQIDQLQNAGCELIYSDYISGKTAERPEFQKMLKYARKGDIITVVSLDRMGRSLIDLIKIIQGLKKREIEFQCINQNFDTTTPHGKLFFRIFASLAEYEREIIVSRTKEGLKAAKLRGVVPGRKRVLTDDAIQAAEELLKTGKSRKEIAKIIGVSDRTLYRRLTERGETKLN